ncbi:hypothetical protein SAMN02745975_01357 [Geosporobacter subterraneus DSM 17957]|uniref:YIEGIA protein n=1 Tax=Geosporobacter subterraneus DSM 17957 TaxID=1121919 RepID=A0A1M6GUE3_9FIRM|nr:YIEGIA family protein [Geosporobacter subterraneus]SHJ13562.1 hypothetical protein SAMN02745975_01357 [Geosporobacter subterraneus DSM 17957]
MKEYTLTILIPLMMGIIARLYMMRIDFRQYPSYPQGLVSHLTLGVIAAALGSVAIPALIKKEYAAVTFLALAAQQFRDVRNMERQSLDNIEPTELVPRGTAYIEDIAKAFEARNYMVIITALFSSITIHSLGSMNIPKLVVYGGSILVGFICLFLLKGLLGRQNIAEIADVIPAEIDFDGPLLKANGTVLMNVGLKQSRQLYLDKGMGVEIIPKDPNASATLATIGQRQAIIHNVSAQLGIRLDIGEPDFTPMARRNLDNGNIVMSIVPMERDMGLLIEAVKRTPVLETTKRKPLQSKVGSKTVKREE